MKSNVSVFAKKITTIHTGNNLGRYVCVLPISDLVGPGSTGACIEFITRDGNSVCGVVVDMTEEIACGRFPDVKGIILDTYTQEQVGPARKRMLQGGYRGTSGAQKPTRPASK